MHCVRVCLRERLYTKYYVSAKRICQKLFYFLNFCFAASVQQLVKRHFSLFCAAFEKNFCVQCITLFSFSVGDNCPLHFLDLEGFVCERKSCIILVFFKTYTVWSVVIDHIPNYWHPRFLRQNSSQKAI